MRLRILGESIIQLGERAIEPSASHLFALLLYLGVERGRWVSRHELADKLFPADLPAAAAHNLRQLLYRARQFGAPIDSNQSTVSLRCEVVDDDVADALNDVQSAARKKEVHSYVLLPHYRPLNSAISEWLESHREKVQHQLIRELCAAIGAARKRADWHAVQGLASFALELDPFNETATLGAAEALARSGSKQRALTLLQSFEAEVGNSSEALVLPSRLLSKRISESTARPDTLPSMPLVGRAHEIARLAAFWTQAQRGRLTVVDVSGEKSVGKSRLILELLSVIRFDGSGAIVATRRNPEDRSRPLSLFADICRQLICMPGAAGCEPTGVSFLQRLTEARQETTRSQIEADEFPRSEHGVKAAIADLLDCVSSERPLVLFVECAQYLDDMSLALINELSDRYPHLALLCLLEGDLAGRMPRGIPVVQVMPLDTVASEALCKSIIAKNRLRVDASAEEWCRNLAAGNPGHLELALEHTSRSLGQLEVPADLLALTAERIDACTAVARRALLAIGLSGSACTATMVECLTGLQGRELLNALEELESSHLITASPTGLRCRSALIEERVLESAPRSVACVMNSRAAKFLERSVAGTSPSQELAWRIARHWNSAADIKRARHWERICWRQLLAIGQPMNAALSIQEALTTSIAPEDRALLLTELACAYRAAREWGSQSAALRERIALAAHIGDSEKLRTALAFDLIESCLFDQDDELEFLPRLRDLVCSRQLDAGRCIRGARRLVIIAYNTLDEELAHTAHEILVSSNPTDAAALMFQKQGALIFHTIFGSPLVARQLADALTRLAEAEWDVDKAAATLANVALARMVVDPAPIALSPLRRVYERCRDTHMHSSAAFYAARLSCILFEGSILDEAAEWIDNAAAMLKSSTNCRLTMDYLGGRADLMMASGNYSEARLLMECMANEVPRLRNGQLRHGVLLHRIRYAQMCDGKRSSEEELQRLLQWHTRAKQYGRHDAHMEVLWVALMSNGREVEATGLLTEYLTVSRRDQRPAAHFLRLRTAEDPAWEQASIARDATPQTGLRDLSSMAVSSHAAGLTLPPDALYPLVDTGTASLREQYRGLLDAPT